MVVDVPEEGPRVEDEMTEVVAEVAETGEIDNVVADGPDK